MLAVAGLLIAAIMFVIFRSRVEVKNFEITEYTINSGKLTGEHKFVVLTDLHNRTYGEHNEELIGAIDRIAPDSVLIIGDMVNKHQGDKFENALSLINGLAHKHHVIYVHGNHEQVLDKQLQKDDEAFLEYREILKKNGVLFLNNRAMPEKDKVTVYGLEIELDHYKHFSRPKLEKDYISSVLGRPDKENYNILLVHTPSYFQQYKEWGADLVISGHHHGGAIILPFLGGVVSPQYILFPKYYAGHFQEGGARLLVSRGIGSHSVNIRVFNKPEVMVVNLSPNTKGLPDE